MLYENVFVFSGQMTGKSAEKKLDDFVEQFKKLGGKILKKESWGLRTLAYKINKNSKGHYFMTITESESNIFKDFDKKVKQDDEILRFLNIKIKSYDKNASLLDESKSQEVKK